MATTADYRPRVAGDLLPGGTCVQCGYAVAPAIPRCPNCGGVIEATDFPAAGRVWSATVVHIPVGDREPPVGLAYVDVTAGPRVLARFDGARVLPVGTPVVLRQQGDTLVAVPVEEA